MPRAARPPARAPPLLPLGLRASPSPPPRPLFELGQLPISLPSWLVHSAGEPGAINVELGPQVGLCMSPCFACMLRA